MRWLILPFLFLFTGKAEAQKREKTTAVNKEQLESLAASREQVPEEDAAVQFRAHAQKHLLTLNTVEVDELNALQDLLSQQVDNLIIYRRLLGKLLSIYESQAIPAWDLSTIQFSDFNMAKPVDSIRAYIDMKTIYYIALPYHSLQVRNSGIN